MKSAARPPEGARPLRLRRGEAQTAKQASLGEAVQSGAHKLLLAAGLAAACALPGLAAAATHTVKIEGMKNVPETLTVKRGDKVVWQNKDVVPHTVTAKGMFDSGSIATGKSWSHVMKKAGRYDYVCTFHPGMKAVVVVE